MSTPSITALVDRGIAVVAEIAKLQKELRTIEETLKGVATDRSDQHVLLKDSEREGRKYLARGSRLVVPVVFTADKLLGTFQAQSKEHLRVAKALPDEQFTELFPVFYKPWNGFENRFDDGQKFRARAAALLGSAAPAFITACLALDKEGLPKSDVKIEWKEAVADSEVPS